MFGGLHTAFIYYFYFIRFGNNSLPKLLEILPFGMNGLETIFIFKGLTKNLGDVNVRPAFAPAGYCCVAQKQMAKNAYLTEIVEML